MISILAPDSILEVDSLEADLILDEQSLEDSIQAIPEPIWPEKSDQVPPNSIKVDKDINYVADISFKKDDNSNDVIDVSRNGTFVRSIQFKNPSNKITPWMGSNMLMKHRIPRMLESQLSPIGEVQNDSKFEDSIVTDALLQMTSFSSNSANANVDGEFLIKKAR